MKSLVFLTLFSITAFGQSGSSVISGNIKDPTGAVIPGAQVKVVNQATGVAVDAVSNELGLYRAASLAPGNYRLEVTVEGFDRLVRGPVVVEVGQVLALDLTLQVGQNNQTVTVTEAAPLVESQTSNVSQLVNQKMLIGLPLPSRTASSLAALAPGVVMIDAGSGTAENYPVFSVAGGRARNQNFVLDGGNVSNAVGLTRPQQLTSLPVDAMQEFRVIANNYAAEYGHSTGGIVMMSTRSGTNQYHGSIFESLQNDILNSRNFFAQTRPANRLNQYGGTFGGPVQKDKTHFFVTWEQTRQLSSDTVASTVPTLLNRNGDFSDIANKIYDPLTNPRVPFDGNKIPLTRLDPVALASLAYFPEPNLPGLANNFVGSSANTLHRNIVVGRLDHYFSSSDTVTARYYINDASTNNSGTYGIPSSDPLADITDVRVQSFLIAHTHTFGPTLANDLRYTYLRRKFLDTRPGFGENLAGAIGLKGVTDAAFPAFTIPGYGPPAGLTSSNIVLPTSGATFGNPTAVYRFQTPVVDQQILDSMSWFHGKHALKFGVEARFGANDEIRDRGSAGNFSFSPQGTGLGSTGGNGFATFLLGDAYSANIQVSDKIPSRAAYWALYLQDDWRITDRLTLNVGIRYDVELPRRVIGNKQNSFDPLAINPVSGTPGLVTFSGLNGTPERAFATDWNNIGPRLGFAYRLPGKHDMVIRSGAGIFYGQTVSNTVGDVASLGFSTSASYTVQQTDTVIQLKNGFPAYSRPALTPGFGAVALGQTPNTSVAFFNPNQVAPTSYQYNFGIQREIAHDLVLEAGYIGNTSHHLTANDFQLNQVSPEQMALGGGQARRPFPQFNSVTWINPSIGNSTYSAGFIRAEKRFGRGVSFLAHYTFSKFIDDVEASQEFGATGSYMDSYRRYLDKGLSGSDVPHHLLITLLYEVRQFKGNRFVSGALSGWKVGALETIESGPSFTVVTATNQTNAFPAGLQRPNLLRDPALPSDQRTLARWFDVSAFVNPAPLTFGNSPRSVLRGASILTTDATLEKSFFLTERWKIDVRAEAYNMLNHTNFNIPGFTLGAAGFGAVSTARAARTVQLAARLSF
jgi:hypothetical protein